MRNTPKAPPTPDDLHAETVDLSRLICELMRARAVASPAGGEIVVPASAIVRDLEDAGFPRLWIQFARRLAGVRVRVTPAGLIWSMTR